MEQKPFPWTGPFEAPSPELPAQEPKALPNGLISIRKHWPLLALIGLILLIFILRKSFPDEAASTNFNPGVDVLMVMLPTAKGSYLVPETLKQVPLERKALSKQQYFQLVRSEDLVNLKGRVRAKKDLPPNKPLFWSDLELKNPTQALPTSQIFYSKEPTL